MIPVRYNLRSLIIRRVGTIMTVLGVALTVAVFVSILAMGTGLQSVYVDTGDPLNLILIRQGSQVETNSFFNRNLKLIVEAAEGVTAVAGEVVVLVNHPRKTGQTANVVVRGISDKSMELRPRVRLAEGRMFRGGLREFLARLDLVGDGVRVLHQRGRDPHRLEQLALGALRESFVDGADLGDELLPRLVIDVVRRSARGLAQQLA